MMRNILVDHARRRLAQKRGAGMEVDMPEISYPGMNLDVLVVHEALERFSAEHERQAQVVELRFFGGLTADETAEVCASRASIARCEPWSGTGALPVPGYRMRSRDRLRFVSKRHRIFCNE